MNYPHRLANARALLPSIPCEALLIENPTNILYLTGIDLSAGKLLISEKENALIVDGRYYEIARKQSPCLVYLLEEMPLKEWLLSHKIQTLAFESDKTTYQTFLTLQALTEELKKNHLSLSLIPAEAPIQKLRLIKDADEIKVLQEAARLGYEGYSFVLSQLEEGIQEVELAIELEIFWKRKGVKKPAFDPIIAFGPNSSMPHYRAGKTPLSKGMHVLIDIGVVWQHYHSDMTRVVLFGTPSSQIHQIFDIVEEAKNQALALCKPGNLIGELDAAARNLISFKGYGHQFNHSLGHGIGLNIHEPPILRQQGPYKDIPLQPGMVFTIEPGIYLPHYGGVRYEDTILITPNGYENLTNPT